MASKKQVGKYLGMVRQMERNQERRHSEWRRAYDLYTGNRFKHDPFFQKLGGNWVNLGTAYVDTHLPTVVFKDPKIFIRARQRYATADFIKFAEALEETVNQTWGDLRFKQEIEKAVLDAIIYSCGWVKVGYQAKFGEFETPQSREAEQSFDQLTQELIQDEKGEERKTRQGKVVEHNEYIKEESVFCEWISTFDMLILDGYDYVEDMPIITQRYTVPLEDFKKDPRFPSSVKKDVPHKTRSQTSSSGLLFHEIPQIKDSTSSLKDEPVVVYYEVWDKRRQKRTYIADGIDSKQLAETDWLIDTEGFPYLDLRYRLAPHHPEASPFYPVPDLIVLEPQLEELSKIINQMANHRKRFSRKYIVGPEAQLSEEEEANLAEPEEGGIVKITGNPDAIKELKDLNLPQDVYQQYLLALEQFRMVSGILQTGQVALKGVETATEAKAVSQGPVIRTSARQDKTEEFMKLIARKIAQLIWQYYDPMTIEEVTGRQLDFQWPEPTRKRVQEELIYSVEAGSARPPEDEAVEREQMTRAISVVSAPQFFPFVTDWSVILRQWLNKMGFKQLELALSSGGKEEQEAQAENELLAQNIPQAVTGNDMAHLQVHTQAGIQTEAMDQHVVEHSQRLQASQGVSPQQGDTRTPSQGASPEIERSGTPRGGDLVGSATNVRRNTGTRTL